MTPTTRHILVYAALALLLLGDLAALSAGQHVTIPDMGTPVSAITTETKDRFVLDAGACFLNYGEANQRPLGATRGGATFTIEQDVRIIEIDGAPGPVKGQRRIVAVRAMASFQLLEFGVDNLKILLPSVTETDLTHHKELKRVTQEIGDDQYITNVAIVANVSGKAQRFIGILDNALLTANVSLATQHQNESVMPCECEAHFDPADMATEPWRIRWPKA